MISDEKSLHMEKGVVFLGMSLLARNGAQTSCRTVRRNGRLKKRLEIEVIKK